MAPATAPLLDSTFDNCRAGAGVADRTGSRGRWKTLLHPRRWIEPGRRHPRDKQVSNVYDLVVETAEYVGVEEIARDKVVANSDYVGSGYGQPTPEMVEAVSLLARTEGILLDPVYSGKAMAGLIGEIRKGTFSKDDNIVFVHTGETAALFAYESAIQ